MQKGKLPRGGWKETPKHHTHEDRVGWGGVDQWSRSKLRTNSGGQLAVPYRQLPRFQLGSIVLCNDCLPVTTDRQPHAKYSTRETKHVMEGTHCWTNAKQRMRNIGCRLHCWVQSGCACERPAIHFKFLLGCSSTASEFLGVLKLVVIFRRKHKVKIAQWLCTILI